MTITYASGTLTLTGGTPGARLTPANVISDAAAFSSAATYAVGAIMKYNAGGGLGTALYRCSTAVTVAGAFNAANWTLVAYLQGTNNLWLETALVISAAHNDDAWSYYCQSGFVYAGTGCDWVSGSALNSKNSIGFTITYTGNGLSSGSPPNFLLGTSGTVNLYDVRFNCPYNANKGVQFQNSAMTGAITGKLVYAENQFIDAPLVVTNISTIRTNLTVNPNGVASLLHSGLYEGNFVDNKIGMLTATASSTVSSGTRYIVATLGTATLANWQAFFSSLAAIPVVGDVLTATASGTLAGSATCKQYRALKKYTPDIPADNSRGVGIIGTDSFQFFEDMVVPDGFNFATQIKAYYGGASLYFTRLVNITAKQGATLLSGIKVRVVNTSDNSQLGVEATNASGAISKQMLIYYGERVGGGSYVALQNPKDYRAKSFTFRRKDLAESVYTADMTINGVELTQFMSTDPYYTTDQSANLADVGFATSGGAITGMTINAAMTMDRLWDITKAYFYANMGIANPFTANGKTFNVASVPVSGAQLLSASTKLTGLQSSGAVTTVGALQSGVNVTGNVTQATPTSMTGVTITGNLTYNTNTAVTITLTNCTISGTVSNSGTGAVSVNLVNSTVTTGANVTAQYPITISDADNRLTSIHAWVFNSLGALVYDTTFQSQVASVTVNMPVGGSLRVYSQPYGYISRITNTSSTSPTLKISHIPETLVDTTLDVTVRNEIESHFSSVMEDNIVYVETDADFAQYTPAQVLNGMHYFIVNRGFLFSASSLFINSVDSLKLIDGGFRVYSPGFRGRAKSTLNATNTPSLVITLPLYIEDASGVPGNQVLVRNAHGIAIVSALWTKAVANITNNDINSIATRVDQSSVLAKEATLAGKASQASVLALPSAAQIASQVETAILTDGDGRAVLQAIADKIGNENVTATVIAQSVRAELAPELANMDAPISGIEGITPEQAAQIDEVVANTRATFAQVSELTN